MLRHTSHRIRVSASWLFVHGDRFFRRCRAYDIDVQKRIVVAFEQIELFAVNTNDIIQFFFLARKFNLFNTVDFFKLFLQKRLPASYSYRDQ